MVSAPASWWLTIPAAGLIVLSALAVYQNSFAGAFVYDDDSAIVGNPTLRQLWPIWRPLWPPRGAATVSGRPLLNLSLAINYALSGLNAWSYHATNLAIHAAAALLLLGILRRTFLTPVLRDRFGKAATPLALAAALIWTVHPLQTESVTYIVQRAESLAGLLYLLTLYCVIRGAAGTVPFFAAHQPVSPGVTSSEKGDCPLFWLSWYTAAVLACLLGMACKEVLVTAPLIALLYDRTFLAGSFLAAWRQRRGLYLALAATWGLLAFLMASTGLLGLRTKIGVVDPFSYARSQPGVMLHYLRLSLWPRPLCLDYAWPVARSLGEILPGAIVVGLLAAATVWGLAARKAWGFLGAWFFLILAPTSSILPLRHLAFEYRMYLPLAAVAVLAVAGGYALCDRLLPTPAGQGGKSPFLPGTALGRAGLWATKKGTVPGLAAIARWAAPLLVLVAVLVALGCATAVRNADYRSLLVIWQDTVDKRPHNAVAHSNLGTALARSGQPHKAIEHFLAALRLEPDYAEAHKNLGLSLVDLGRIDEAIKQFREAVRWEPDYAEARYNLGIALAAEGKTGEAIEEYREAVRLKPDFPEAHNNLANMLASIGKTGEAIEHCRQALRVRPDFADAEHTLGFILAGMNRSDEALKHCQEALRLKPDYAEAHNTLAAVLLGLGKTDEAIAHFQQAARLKPDFVVAHDNLSRVLAAAGRTREAIQNYDRVLQLTPDSPSALRNLAWLLATSETSEGGDPARALRLAERLCGLSGQENAQYLDTLAAAYAAAGRFGDAVSNAERALQLAESTGQTALGKDIRLRLDLYRAGRPYRQTSRSPEPTKPGARSVHILHGFQESAVG
jgi:tetratricopeptide (TPR) repeat protein